ncbi:hypothetical protein [Promicromonospora sp. NFX87]|uniref:hypothetical protein n=1 Tax=Promicromonospora sp. NFX87 TaxID=3402691 RepID=UPI003AFA0B9F
MINDKLEISDQRGWHLGPPPRDPATERDHAYLSARAAHDHARRGTDAATIAATRQTMYIAFVGTSWCIRAYPYWTRPKPCGQRGCEATAEVVMAWENGQVSYEAICEGHRCDGTNTNGRRCRKQAMRDSVVCATHRSTTGA